jgi:group I intron endonuclease
MIAVYKIGSKAVPDHYYIGSTVNFAGRKQQHLQDLRKGIHSSLRLQNHYNRYGESDLIFSIIVECSKEFLVAYEQYYIDVLNPYYNVCKIAGNCLGIKHSKETRKKLSKLRQGKNNSFYGKHHSEETKEKNRQAHLGSHHSEETKEKMRQAHLGQKRSEEAKRRMSEWQKGINKKPASEETKKLMSLSGIKAWKLRKQLV